MDVFVDINDKDRITAKCGWYPDAAIDAKSVPGARWDKDRKQWHYPLVIETCHALRRVYGDRLRISPKLSNWAKAVIQREKSMIELGASRDADLKVIPGRFELMDKAMANRTYQRSGARFIAEGRSVGIFDEVGLGKTITSIAGIIEAGKFEGQHLVVSNKTSLWSVWFNEVTKWTEGKADVFVCEGAAANRKKTIKAFMESDSASKWLVVNPAMLMVKIEDWCPKCKKWDKDLRVDREEDLDHFTMAHKLKGEVSVHKYPELQEIIWDSTIVDEAHKTMSTGIKSGAKNKLTQTGVGLTALRGTPDYMRIALTGTPTRGKELQLWGILHWLYPQIYTSKWAWVDHYFEKSTDFMGHTLVGGLREDAKDNFWRMIDRHCLRRTRKEVRGELPESESYIKWVSLSGKHAKQYFEFEKMGSTQLENGILETGDVLSELTRLKQLAYGVWDWDENNVLQPTSVSPKLELLVDTLEEYGITGKEKDDFRASPNHYKYVVATQFTRVANQVQKHLESLGIPCLLITGDVTPRKRGEAVTSFQEDPDGPRVLILNTYAGGESITVDRYCDTMFILDETFVADDQAQLYGRIDNRSVSAEDAVPRRFIHILTKGTIDEAIAESNLSQLEMEHLVLDKRRGLEISKLFIRKEL